ncbi:acetylcholinesterase, putative [Ixodes scapularis]|uniref:Carboxylic ester hydrolase n=1 Tax=Ixodes scapularis TaxID=6945 RepID=B7QN61_IXOSC|nr:acetylcholinesterase, putative [Ixodes scapularis]|eukprot:XP_002400739.1 acetylcholinesterase, putative [Ixodes scapularis]
MVITIIILILSNVIAKILFHKQSSQDCFQVSLVTGQVMGLPVNFQHAGHTYHTTAFLGIPFADNTGGTRRFKKPNIYHGWEGVFNATYTRKPCCQRIMKGQEKYISALANNTEDCLHLNIWVPTDCMQRIQKIPVMFWVYGGGFVFGGNNIDVYDGRYIAGFGNLIVVVPNYRVGSFGFLNAQTEDVPGNMGMHDVIAAYRWVRDHIGSFGGDRENIILAGQSAGSIISGLLMISPAFPLTLFSKAYLMSGSVFTLLPENSNDSAAENFQKIAKEANCWMTTTAESLYCLRARTSAEIIAAEHSTKQIFSPSHYDEILPSDINTLFKNVNASNKTILLSTTRLDGSDFFESLFKDVVDQGLKVTPSTLKSKYPSFFKNVSPNMIGWMLASFGGVYNISQDEDMGWREIFTDVLFRCPMESMGKEFDNKGATVFFQEFWPKPSFRNSSVEHASHADDVFMLFGYPFLYPSLATDIERQTSLRMIETLAAFSRDG